jgi:hypothetical protein
LVDDKATAFHGIVCAHPFFKHQAMSNSNNRGNNSGRENEGSKPGSKSRQGSGIPKTTQTGGQSGGGTHRTEDRDLNQQGSRGPNKKSR